jgi:hemerythrin
MPLIDLDSIAQVALAFMNADHRGEASLLNQLADAVEQLGNGGGERLEVLRRFDALLAQTGEHFERENQAMVRARFPALEVHKAEHDRVLAEMRAVRDAFERGGPFEPLRRYLVETVPPWFVSHIGTMDTVTSAFVKANGGS